MRQPSAMRRYSDCLSASWVTSARASASAARAKHSAICSLTFTSKAHPIHITGRERNYLSVTDAPRFVLYSSLSVILGSSTLASRESSHDRLLISVSGTSLSGDAPDDQINLRENISSL